MPSFLQLHPNIQLLRKLMKSSMYVFILYLIFCSFVFLLKQRTPKVTSPQKHSNNSSAIQVYPSIKKTCPVHLHRYPKDLPNQHCETKQHKHSHFVSFKPRFVLSDKMSNASFWQNISLKPVPAGFWFMPQISATVLV